MVPEETAPGQTAGGERQARITPRSKRGVRTRNALIQGAREVFERDGYLDARIVDISKAAGAASGSFYTYFNDKEEIFAALVELVQEEMLHPHLRERTGVSDPREVIEAANRDYLEMYRRNARLMALFEQVAQINENFHRLRLERGTAFAERNARMIRELQERGQADPEIAPLVTAYALSAMVSRMAYMVFVAELPITFDDLVDTLNKLWANALRLKPSP
ncbi:TetR/AcrR family transcriptional regulator [Actinomadura violacea]|uniref:TetR/AcrR family transcriptional regulator n=1 Tax=Actinomadura violacea TaxID=2819934 RepID=A0ABS3RMX3_9ACTN|nr:TetR/AcrR family transcriptional regulator [Actinomadura violacea]MBO2458083.1 TetR/AcrR family transcriptional regulator [Actinomadura violacea]